MSRFSLCSLLSILPFAALSACNAKADSDIGATAIWHYPGGQLIETTVGSDGRLELRYCERTEGNSMPEISIDLIYGGFFVGDLADLSVQSFPLDNPESFRSYLRKHPTLPKSLNRSLHTGGEKARIEAIDQFWEDPTPGTEIAYPFAIYEERIEVREIVDLEHVRAGGGTLRALLVEVPRVIGGKQISTTRYWFEADAPRRLLQWGHDMGREYHLEVRQPDE